MFLFLLFALPCSGVVKPNGAYVSDQCVGRRGVLVTRQNHRNERPSNQSIPQNTSHPSYLCISIHSSNLSVHPNFQVISNNSSTSQGPISIALSGLHPHSFHTSHSSHTPSIRSAIHLITFQLILFISHGTSLSLPLLASPSLSRTPFLN